MAMIAQKNLFSWKKLEKLPDLKQLEILFKNLPDEKLMRKLESNRKKGRDDYPVRAMWNSMLAGIVFEHKGIEPLRRELKRNPSLLEICGFNIFKKGEVVPTASAYTRFLKSLLKEHMLITEMFNNLVEECKNILPGFGKNLALDGKAIPSFAVKSGSSPDDNRGDHDANWGKHVYSGIGNDGKLWEKVKSWFGYTLHLLIDSDYGLPVNFTVTRASMSEIKIAPVLIESTRKCHPKLIAGTQYLSGDRGYDTTNIVSRLWDNYSIKPIIDIKNMWKDPDNTKMLPGYDNVVYNFKGVISCYCPKTNKKKEMAYGGFEKDRKALKYKCPAKAYGYECRGREKCPAKSGLRIPLTLDRRIFTPVARSSYKWKTLYKKRTAVERVNSRLDVSFGFENHTIRGQKKMSMRVSLAFIIMLSLAVGWTKEGRPDLIRSLVRSA